MGILERIHEAQLHREVYIATLKSLLQEKASKRQLAEQIGITQQYLSYLLNAQTDDPYSFRIPSPKVAEKIANALPLESEQREHLLKHIYLARDGTSQITSTLRSELLAHPLEDVLKELRDAHQEANFATDPQIARIKYLVIRDTCKMLLEHAVLYTYPLNTVEVCLLLHDAQCILNRTADALYHAKLARAVIDSLSYNKADDKERLCSYQIQILRAEARAYCDLRLYREAYETCLQAETSDAMRYQAEDCRPQLYRDKLQALCRKPRFALSEAEGLVARVRTICDGADNELAARWLFMADQYLARAYLNHYNLKKAKRLLSAILTQMDAIPHLGPLHQTMFLKTYARFRWLEGDSAEWEYFLRRALTSAMDAGLTHQISDIKQTYGLTIAPLLQELEATKR